MWKQGYTPFVDDGCFDFLVMSEWRISWFGRNCGVSCLIAHVAAARGRGAQI